MVRAGRGAASSRWFQQMFQPGEAVATAKAGDAKAANFLDPDARHKKHPAIGVGHDPLAVVGKIAHSPGEDFPDGLRRGCRPARAAAPHPALPADVTATSRASNDASTTCGVITDARGNPGLAGTSFEIGGIRLLPIPVHSGLVPLDLGQPAPDQAIEVRERFPGRHLDDVLVHTAAEQGAKAIHRTPWL